MLTFLLHFLSTYAQSSSLLLQDEINSLSVCLSYLLTYSLIFVIRDFARREL